MPKKILIAASNYWNSPYQVGSHHYARVFAKNGWDVLFVSDPISPIHFLVQGNEQLRERYKIYKGLYENDIKNIETYVPMALITPNEKPVFNTRFVAEHWHNLTIPNIVTYAKKMGFGEVDILWFDSITQYFWINVIKYRNSVFRLSDKLDSFKKIGKNAKNLERELMNRVDYIIYTSRVLETYLKGYEHKMIHISNGVNIDHFFNASRNIPEDLKHIPEPRAIYVGAIDEWFDIDLLSNVAKNCREISFIIIGNSRIDLSKLINLSNVFLLGKKDYKEIPAYMYNSNVGIIPFNKNHPIVQSINPIKLYEYMSCGLPVVATRWKELEIIKSPAYLADNVNSFIEGLKIALQDINKNKYLKFARTNSWDLRYKDVIKFLGNQKHAKIKDFNSK